MYKYKNKDVLRIYRGGTLLYERVTEIIEPMLVTPSDFNISISSASDLEIDWGDGTVQTVKSGDDTTYEHLGLICKNYTHTYTDSYIDKTISVKHLDGASPIQFFSSSAIKTVERWYSEGYQHFELLNPTNGAILNMTFYGLGPQLETVPNIAPPKTNVLSGLFLGAQAFNQDISMWDVSNVTNLSYTFAQAVAFNQPIGNWDVSNVTNMQGMFEGAAIFNDDLSQWDTSATTDMSRTFYGASTFDQPIGNWDVSNVTNMEYMFCNAISFNQDIGTWDVSNVTNMNTMFYNAAVFNSDISGWDVSKVVNMSRMFYVASTFNQDIGNWNVSNVMDMEYMFSGATSFNQDLSGWCVSEITQGPTSFSTGSPLTTEHKPVWGTCPRGENSLTT